MVTYMSKSISSYLRDTPTKGRELFLRSTHLLQKSKGRNQPQQICRLLKSLYGLKQAPKQWFSKLSSTLISFGSNQSIADPSLFTRQTDASFTAILVYVDMLVTGNDLEDIKAIKLLLSKHFQMKDVGELRYFLGLEIARTEQGIFVSQKKYVLDLLKKAGLLDARPYKLPLDQHTKLSTDKGVQLKNPDYYRRLIGKLI